MEKYIAIIGDIIESKKIKKRSEFQESVKEAFAIINEKYKESIRSNLTLTIGDEFQAILRLDDKLMRILDEIYLAVKANFRLGIGYGEISTKIDKKLSIGADGQAFWRARQAIEYVHSNNHSGKCNIYFIGQDAGLDSTVNSLFMLTETLKSQWTDLQKETFAKMLEQGIYHDIFNQQEFAKKIGISESSLSKRLSLGNIKIYLKARLEINRFMEVNSESL